MVPNLLQLLKMLAGIEEQPSLGMRQEERPRLATWTFLIPLHPVFPPFGKKCFISTPARRGEKIFIDIQLRSFILYAFCISYGLLVVFLPQMKRIDKYELALKRYDQLQERNWTKVRMVAVWSYHWVISWIPLHQKIRPTDSSTGGPTYFRLALARILLRETRLTHLRRTNQYADIGWRGQHIFK